MGGGSWLPSGGSYGQQQQLQQQRPQQQQVGVVPSLGPAGGRPLPGLGLIHLGQQGHQLTAFGQDAGAREEYLSPSGGLDMSTSARLPLNLLRNATRGGEAQGGGVGRMSGLVGMGQERHQEQQQLAAFGTGADMSLQQQQQPREITEGLNEGVVGGGQRFDGLGIGMGGFGSSGLDRGGMTVVPSLMQQRALQQEYQQVCFSTETKNSTPFLSGCLKRCCF